MRFSQMAPAVVLTLAAMALPHAASAQDRQVGRKGATQLSFNASVSAKQSTGASFGGFEVSGGNWSGDYRFAIESGQFLSDRLVLSVGTSVGGFIGGSGGITNNLNGGLRLYMTPSSTVSPYVSGGGGFSTFRVSGNTASDALVYGAGGVDAAVRDNAIVFFEGAFDRLFVDGGGQNAFRFNVGLRVLF
jgi:hypothetical protein